MKGLSIMWHEDELRFVEARKEWPRAELHAALVSRFDRHDVSISNLNSLCKRRGWRTGRTGHFKKGEAPHNKGKPMPLHPNSAATCFKKGTRNGWAADLHKPVGAERISKDGYLERKVHEGLPMQSRWRAVHIIRWESENGAIPDGCCLKCLDGDRSNTDPANWKSIPREMLPKLNGRWAAVAYDSAPDEIKPTLMATAELDAMARDILRRRAKDK